MRTKPHHVRNLECTATVVERVGARDVHTREPIRGNFKFVNGKMDSGEWVHYTYLSCGHSHDDLPVGTTIICKWCESDRRGLFKLEEGLKAGIISHTRCHTVTPNSITAYKYVPTSPTGVLSYCSVDDTPEANELISKYRGMSPLSPTEKR